jgi:TonB family protein
MERTARPGFVTLLIRSIAGIILIAAVGSEAIAQDYDIGPKLDWSHSKEPRWPRGAPREGGRVTLSVDIDEKGNVIDARIVSVEGADVFGPAAVDAMKHWHFHPALKNGKPVAVANYTAKVTFPPCDCNERR